jgi:hypothetical protein
MLTLVPLALMLRPPAATRRLAAVTLVPLGAPQSQFDVTVGPHNSRSVRKHGMMVRGAESLFGMIENAFRANG